jgi:hypothetical protein
MDTNSKVIIDFNFNKLSPFNSGLAWAEKYDTKTSKRIKGFINKKGQFVIIIEQPIY